MGAALTVCAMLALALTAQAQTSPAGSGPSDGPGEAQRDVPSGEPSTPNETSDPAGSPASEDSNFESAKAAFERGTELAADERWSDAAAAFADSFALRPHPLVAYNIGFCERALGRPTRARHWLREALSLEKRGTGTLTDAKRGAAVRILEELDDALVRVPVRLEPTGAVLTVDGRPLIYELHLAGVLGAAGVAPPGEATPPPSAVFTMLIDPGPAVLVVRYRDRPEVVVETEFAAGAPAKPLTIVVPEPPPPPAPPPPILLETKVPRGWTTLEIAGLAMIGGGGALGVVAGVTGGLALAADAELDSECLGTNCPPGVADDIDRRDALATAATVSTVAAIGLGALGLTFFLWPSDEDVQVSITPRTTHLRFSF